jgi:hypothetical protein
MDIRHVARYAAMAAAARRRIQRAGRTPRGHFLWTNDEDRIVVRLYPDYRALRKTLKRRTYNALRARARSLGVAKRRHIWTTSEVSRLRRLYLNATTQETLAAFPGMTWWQLAGKARHIGLRGRRPRFKLTGLRLVDDIRGRAYARGWSMVELDAMAGTKRYFQKAGWHSARTRLGTRRDAEHGAWLKAIKALDGQIAVTWR